jgi:hypothetical protein
MTDITMSTKKVIPKKRGRPATGRDPQVVVRMPEALIEKIDEWASKNEVSRSEAMRLLLTNSLARSSLSGLKY